MHLDKHTHTHTGVHAQAGLARASRGAALNGWHVQRQPWPVVVVIGPIERPAKARGWPSRAQVV